MNQETNDAAETKTITVTGLVRLQVRCDACNACFTCGPGRLREYSGTEAEELRADARAHGWTGDMTKSSTNDRCPPCSTTQHT